MCASASTSNTSATALPLLVVLLGPTASGKTSLALALAERFAGEIISCDSVAVYRGMDIGTAKPSARERARVPHHLLDIARPDQPYSAGDYSRDARAALADITSRHKLPIVSGGTGLYLRAFLDGLFTGPLRSEPLRARLRASAERHDALQPTEKPTGKPDSTTWLHRMLLRLDPESAARIHPHDEAKLIRALEVSITTREPLSAALGSSGRRDPLSGYRVLRLGLQPDRRDLYARINRRAAAMFSNGLVDETRGLLALYHPVPPPLDALGYRQAARMLAGHSTLAEAIADAQQGHRNYAKRQLTWFRREPSVQWLPGFGYEPSISAAASLAVAGAALNRS